MFCTTSYARAEKDLKKKKFRSCENFRKLTGSLSPSLTNLTNERTNLPKGTSPHPVQKAFMRNTLQVDDIEGTKVGWRPKYRENFGRNVRDLNLDVRDINKMRKKKIKAEKEPIDVGVKRQTKRPQSVTYSLKTNDIDGAQSRPRGRYLPCGQKRTQYVHTNNTQDIRGATPKKRSDRRPYSAPIDRTGLSSRASNLIESKIRESIQRQYHDISNSFRNLDRDGSGKLTTEEFSRVMSKCEIRMAEDEAKLVVQGFDTNNSGTVDYAKVLKAIGPSYVSQNLGRSSAAEVAEPAAPAETLGGGDENAVVDAEVQTAAQPVGPSPEEEGAAGAEKSAPTPAPAQASKPATLSQRIEEARRGSQEEEWKPSKFAVVKADRPHTVSASSRPQRAKAQRQKAAQRPMTSPGGGRRRKVSIQSKPATLERPRSAFTNVKCRTQTWERSQLREDIATIRALR